MTDEEHVFDAPKAEQIPMRIFDMNETKKIIEAVLFTAGEPVSYEKLAGAAGITADEARFAAREMMDDYSSRGIRLLCYDDGAQLCTAGEYAAQVKQALGITRTLTLSQSALEVLAVIAYNQPATRTYVEQIRGVDSGYALSVLLARGLVETRGRLDAPGKPNLYVTTDAFLRMFGIESLDQLPPLDVINGQT